MNAVSVASLDACAPRQQAPFADGFVALDACHRKTLNALTSLERLAAAIERNESTPALREAAAATAAFLSTTARLHHEDEERHVFPALRGIADPQLTHAVLRLTQDHGWLEEDWRELAPHVVAFAQECSSCDTQMLVFGLPVFAALYREHIALEESLVYPEARARMDGAERQTMGREIAANWRAHRRTRQA